MISLYSYICILNFLKTFQDLIFMLLISLL